MIALVILTEFLIILLISDLVARLAGGSQGGMANHSQLIFFAGRLLHSAYSVAHIQWIRVAK